MKTPDVALSGQFHAPVALPLGKELSVPNEKEAGWDADPVRAYPRTMISLTVTDKLTDKQMSKKWLHSSKPKVQAFALLMSPVINISLYFLRDREGITKC